MACGSRPSLLVFAKSSFPRLRGGVLLPTLPSLVLLLPTCSDVPRRQRLLLSGRLLRKSARSVTSSGRAWLDMSLSSTLRRSLSGITLEAG